VSVATAIHDGAILVVTLDRPAARNAIDARTAAGVAAAMDRLEAEPELRVGVLNGAGGVFCAGMDLKAFAAGERPVAGGRGFGGLVERPPAKPLIAAVEGFAVAGGFELALACDVIVAARGARLGLPEVKRALVASGGGLLRLPRAVPDRVARELALTGDPIDAERAYALGLVNRVTEPGEALTGALALARAIASNGPLALAATKRILDAVPAAEWARQQELAAPVFASEDAREGAVAFAEKRPPVWRSR
jgi:enoyl-CoA hydratase